MWTVRSARVPAGREDAARHCSSQQGPRAREPRRAAADRGGAQPRSSGQEQRVFISAQRVCRAPGTTTSRARPAWKQSADAAPRKRHRQGAGQACRHTPTFTQVPWPARKAARTGALLVGGELAQANAVPGTMARTLSTFTFRPPLIQHNSHIAARGVARETARPRSLRVLAWLKVLKARVPQLAPLRRCAVVHAFIWHRVQK